MTASLHTLPQVDPVPPTVDAGHDWLTAITEVLHGEGPDVATQPIVDLRRGTIVGFEALSRFPGTVAGPDVWFAAAHRLGLGPSLEARSLAAALALRPDLPQNCFLSVNISPAVLGCPEVDAVLAAAGSLDGVVIELTEHDAITDFDALARRLGELRAHGAQVAMDDAGSGYAGLQWLAAIRPDVVKVDRELVAGLDRDPTKVAMIEMLGSLTGHLDGWLLAEGVERVEELDALIRLGVPLAQGYLLARPNVPSWPSLAPSMARHIRAQGLHRLGDTVESLLESPETARSEAAATTALLASPRLEFVVVTDDRSRPIGLRTSADPSLTVPALKVKADEMILAVARRCLTRPLPHRWLPVVCVDALGRYAGIVRTEQVMRHLLERPERQPT